MNTIQKRWQYKHCYKENDPATGTGPEYRSIAEIINKKTLGTGPNYGMNLSTNIIFRNYEHELYRYDLTYGYVIVHFVVLYTYIVFYIYEEMCEILQER